MLVREQCGACGTSGGTLERPGPQRLLENIEDGLVDVVVVYKIYRLSRSPADFVNLFDEFDRNRMQSEPALQRAPGIARVLGMEPIVPALAHRVELNPMHGSSRTDCAGLGSVKEVGLQHLQLQRNGQAVRGSPQAAAHQNLARLDHLAADERL